jgi:hypothetical protein
MTTDNTAPSMMVESNAEIEVIKVAELKKSMNNCSIKGRTVNKRNLKNISPLDLLTYYFEEPEETSIKTRL